MADRALTRCPLSVVSCPWHPGPELATHRNSESMANEDDLYTYSIVFAIAPGEKKKNRQNSLIQDPASRFQYPIARSTAYLDIISNIFPLYLTPLAFHLIPYTFHLIPFVLSSSFVLLSFPVSNLRSPQSPSRPGQSTFPLQIVQPKCRCQEPGA